MPPLLDQRQMCPWSKKAHLFLPLLRVYRWQPTAYRQPRPMSIQSFLVRHENKYARLQQRQLLTIGASWEKALGDHRPDPNLLRGGRVRILRAIMLNGQILFQMLRTCH